MPPRHGKSELISRFAPAWYLGNFPDNKVMLCSYADTFAAQWGRRARDVLEEFGPDLWGVSVDSETAGGQLWEVRKHDGIMVTAGVGGGITGKGAHLLIIDDPVKNAEDAASQNQQEKQFEWWKSTARTRLQAGGGVILVMTRWHESDLAGRLIKDGVDGEGDKWEVLNLPAFAEEGDLLNRPEGEVLWPEMFDAEWMEQTRRALGTYWFTALYQQRPSPAEGMMFKRSNFRYYERTSALNEHGDPIVKIHRDAGTEIFDPAYGTKFSTMDVAASSNQDADYTVVSTWLVTPQKDLLLWDRERVQFEGPDLAPLVRRVYASQRPGFIGIERLGHGLNIIQELIRDGLPIIRLEPDKDKVARALPAMARYEEHRIFHPMNTPWVTAEWEPELLSFPNGANDDQVDTLAYAALRLPSINHQSRFRYSTDQRVRDAAPVRARGRGGQMTGGMLEKAF